MRLATWHLVSHMMQVESLWKVLTGRVSVMPMPTGL